MSIYGTEGARPLVARRDGHSGNTTVYHRMGTLPSPRAGDNVGLQSQESNPAVFIRSHKSGLAFLFFALQFYVWEYILRSHSKVENKKRPLQR